MITEDTFVFVLFNPKGFIISGKLQILVNIEFNQLVIKTNDFIQVVIPKSINENKKTYSTFELLKENRKFDVLLP